MSEGASQWRSDSVTRRKTSERERYRGERRRGRRKGWEWKVEGGFGGVESGKVGPDHGGDGDEGRDRPQFYWDSWKNQEWRTGERDREESEDEEEGKKARIEIRK